MAAVADLLVRVKGDTSDVNAKLGKLGDGFGKLGGLVGKAALAGGAAIVAMGVKGVVAFAGFSKGMNEVFTLLPDISGQAMGEMEEDVKSLAKEMGVLPDTVIPALYQAISAGVPEKNVFEFMELASKASIGGVTDLETAVDGITSTVNAFGAEVITAAEASDLMLTSVRLGKTTFGELSKSLFQVNPVAAGLGVAFSDVTASLAALTSQGVPTSVAATQIRGALVELGKDGTAASDVFQELSGVTFTEFIAAGGDMKGAFDLMAEGADDMGVGVGDLFGSVEAGMAVIALTSEAGAAKFGESMDAMKDSSGATQAAFETMDEGLGRSWNKIKSVIAVAVIEIGERLAPFVSQMQEWFEEQLPSFIETAMGWFDKLIGAVQNFVAGAQMIKDWFTGLSEKIRNIITVVGLLVVALAALYANPVMAGLALVALAVAFIGAQSREAAGHVGGIRRDLESFSLISIDTLTDIFGKDNLQAMRDAGLSLSDITAALRGTGDEAFEAKIKISKYLEAHGAGQQILSDVGGKISLINRELREQEANARATAAELFALAKREGEQGDLLDKVARAAAANNREQKEAVDILNDELGPALEGNAADFTLWEESLSVAAAAAKVGVESGIDDMIDIFAAAPEQIKISVDEMIANILEQAEVAAAFKESMGKLADAGLDAVVQQLKDAGPAAADAAAKLAADMSGAFALELVLDKLAGNALNRVQLALDSIDLTDIDAVLQALVTELGLSERAAINLAIQLGLLDGTDVRFTISGRWSIPPPPTGFLPDQFFDIGSGIFLGHGGGIVPGPPGKEVAAILLGGEEVTPIGGTPSARQGGGIFVERMDVTVVDDLRDPGAGRRFIERLARDLDIYNRELA